MYPYTLCDEPVGLLVRRAIISAPRSAVNRRYYSANLKAKNVVLIGRTSYPMAFKLLTIFCDLNRLYMSISRFVTIYVILKRILRRFYGAYRCPTVAAYPRVLATIITYILEMCVLDVTVRGIFFLVMRSTLYVLRMFVRLIRVRLITNSVVRLYRCERRRVRAI